jgi:hypothetical protein
MSYLNRFRSSTIPVVFIHRGSHRYLQESIYQAKRMGNTVILIGDHQFDGLDEFHLIDSYKHEIAAVESMYIHKSTNPPDFEIFCIARWFILASFVIKMNRNTVYYSDSDVFIYFRTDDVYPRYSSSELMYTSMYDQPNFRWSASGCCSFWKREQIIAFTHFVRNLYTTNISILDQKEKYHRENNIPGGICDMTLLYLFSQTRSFVPLNKVFDHCVFDQNVRDNDNYYKNEYNKTHIIWKNDIPFMKNNLTGEVVQFYTLVEYAKIRR